MQRTPELLRLLLDAEVEFVIIGGVAAIAYGSATFTQDFDITPAELSANRNLYLLTDLGRLDLLSEVVPVGSYEQVAARAMTLELYGRPCRIISLDDLITVKHHLGRDKDRVVERELLALRARQQASKP